MAITHITQIFNFPAPAATARTARSFSPPYRENPMKCNGCPDGYYLAVNRDGVSVHECEQCGAVRGVDQPGDIEMQGRTCTGGRNGS